MLQPSEHAASVCGHLHDVHPETPNAEAPPALICQGLCGQTHGRCTYDPKGYCVKTKGHERPHKCSICNQDYM